MKIKTFELMRVITIVFFVGFFICCIYAIDKHHDEKAISDGKRYSELPIIKTVEKDNYIYYILGDDVNQIEVKKYYYERAIEDYKESQREK
ncbi:hypothetical protein ACJ9E6_004102 [Providencia rettgeri]